MRKNAVRALAILAGLSFLGVQAFASSGPLPGDLGIGVEGGQPSGATAKYWIDGNSAVDAGFGESNGDAALNADLLWHAWDAAPQPRSGRLGLYFGAGPRLQFAKNTEFAVRTLIGLSYWVAEHPIELFAEAGPVFQLTQGSDVYPDGGVGARFYFNWRVPSR